MTPKSGRAIAWLSFLLGIGVSIAGNIGHAASDGMKPGEWAGAAFWPLALMLTIEILTRVRWQQGRHWTAARVAGLVLVAMVAAVLSYRHLAGLMTYWGEDPLNAYLGPLAVDGLMLTAATALLSISKESNLPEKWQNTPEEISRKAYIADLGIEDNADAITEANYWADLDQKDDVDGPELLPEPEPEKSKLHVVNSVSKGDSESAAQQAFLQSGGKLKPQDLMSRYGMSRSTAYRRINEWSGGSGQVSGRRIER